MTTVLPPPLSRFRVNCADEVDDPLAMDRALVPVGATEPLPVVLRSIVFALPDVFVTRLPNWSARARLAVRMRPLLVASPVDEQVSDPTEPLQVTAGTV